MKLVIITFSSLILFSGCFPSSHRYRTSKSLRGGHSHFDEILVTPEYLVVEVTKGRKNSRLSKDGISVGSTINYVFYNKSRDSHHAMLNDDAVITDFWYQRPERDRYDYRRNRHAVANPEFFIAGVVFTDYNSDGNIQDDDLVEGFVVSKDGKSMTRITPKAHQLVDYICDDKGKKLFLKVRQDSNGNDKFDLDDKVKFLVVDINKPSIGREIFSDVKFAY